MKTETIEEYLARGKTITRIEKPRPLKGFFTRDNGKRIPPTKPKPLSEAQSGTIKTIKKI